MTKTNPRVFLLEPPKSHLDPEGLKLWGEVQIILMPGRGRERVNIFDAEIYCRDIEERLRDLQFNPDDDYICMMGPVLGIAFLIRAVERSYGKVKVLMFNARKSCYTQTTLERQQ